MRTDRDSELERLYREEGQRLWRAVFAFAGDREVASDAVAEAFSQALYRENAIRSPSPWIWRAAFRIAAGELKERNRRTSKPPEGVYEMEEIGRELVSALARLSPKQREAVVLYHSAGYSVKEIAAILGSTSAAVRVHLKRGRSRLRDLLEDENG